MENKIIVFSRQGCKYCDNAKNFLNELQLPFNEIKLKPSDKNYECKRDQLFHYYKHYSYPVIVINNELVGGYSDLVKAYDTLKLHKMCNKIGLELSFDL
jgi:glutaredoxin